MAEALDKACVKPGCRELALYGFGAVRKETMRFACAAHRGLLPDPAARGSPRPDRAGDVAHTAPPPAQARLL